MAPIPPTFSQSSTSIHLARIKSIDNGPKDYLMEDSGNFIKIRGNNSAQQALIYRTFTNSEETLQQSLNLGHLLILMLKVNNIYIREI